MKNLLMRTLLPPTSAKNTVANGVDLLDEHFPDWWLRLDLGRLDMRNTSKCVLGQTLGQIEEDLDDSEKVYDQFLADTVGEDKDYEYGFCDTTWVRGPDYDIPYISSVDLHLEWVRVVTARREGAS